MKLTVTHDKAARHACVPNRTQTLCSRPLRLTGAPNALTGAPDARSQLGGTLGQEAGASSRGARVRRWGRGAFKARVRPSERAQGPGDGAGPRRGCRAASPAVPSARNRGAGGCEAGGRTGPRERAARWTWPRSRSRAAVVAAQPGRRCRARSSGGGGDQSSAIRTAAGSGLRAPGIGRALGRGAAGKMTAGSGVLLVLLSLSGALRVSCRLPSRPPGSPGSVGPLPEPAGLTLARRGSPGLPRPAPGAPAARTAASCRLPRSAKPPAVGRSAEPRVQRGAVVRSEVGVWVSGGRRELCLNRDPPGIPPLPQVRGRCPGARLPRAGAGCPLAEPARPPSPARRAPPELASPARAGAADEGGWQQPAGHQCAEDTRSGRPCWGLRARDAAPSLSSSSDRWQGPSMRVGNGCGPWGTLAPDSRPRPVSGGALAARSGVEEPGARQEQGEVYRERGPRARLPPAEPASSVPSPAPRPLGAGPGGRRSGKAAGPRELQEPPLVADPPRCSSRAALL
uniref:Uncharacterized protein n=1 Tax=Rangifer tarandus platyrhynchus TaxID=3082113 RepID=A0ACB0FIX5_RANTA|nr:unnamed protein product [Rangifer tarandus platyrhynchus]